MSNIFVNNELHKALNGRSAQSMLYELLGIGQPIAESHLQQLAIADWPTLEFEQRHFCLVHRSLVADTAGELQAKLQQFRELSRAEFRCRSTIKSTAVALLTDGSKRRAVHFLDAVCYSTFAAGDTELHKSLWLLGCECIVEESTLADSKAYDIAAESLRSANSAWEATLLRHCC
jgi:hypothetical protein